MLINSIDEINAYRNKDGTFSAEFHGMVSEEQIKITIPRASISLRLSDGIGNQPEIEIKLEGYIERM